MIPISDAIRELHSFVRGAGAPLSRVALFGSVARGANEVHDIDVLLEAEDGHTDHVLKILAKQVWSRPIAHIDIQTYKQPTIRSPGETPYHFLVVTTEAGRRAFAHHVGSDLAEVWRVGELPNARGPHARAAAVFRAPGEEAARKSCEESSGSLDHYVRVKNPS